MEYFGKMHKQMESGAYEALLWFLLNLKIEVDLRNCMPVTNAMKDSKIHSMSPVQSFWYECLVEGMFDSELNWEGPHIKTCIYGLFKEQSRKSEHFSKEVFFKELKNLSIFKIPDRTMFDPLGFHHWLNAGMTLRRSMGSRLPSLDSLAGPWQL